MRNAPAMTIVAAACIVSSACGSSKELTRTKASDLIQAYPQFAASSEIAIDAQQLINDKAIFMARRGIGYDWELSPEAKPYFKSAPSLNQAITLMNPVKRKVVNVEGITDGPVPGIKEVQFTWKYDAMPDYVARYAKPATTTTAKGSANLRLYDDGWRVEDFAVQ